MMIVHLEGGKAQMLSVPRDLYLPIAGTDGSNKINASYNADLGGGPERLVDTITQSLGIPIDRYMEIDFVSFAGLVDALGGVTIPFENPAQDEASGLFVPEAGNVELDGDQALAYVRSREFTETINGEQVVDGSGDLGRIQRQQTFLSVVFNELSGREPVHDAPGRQRDGRGPAHRRRDVDVRRHAARLGPARPRARTAGVDDDERPQRGGGGPHPRRGGLAARPRRGALSAG